MVLGIKRKNKKEEEFTKANEIYEKPPEIVEEEVVEESVESKPTKSEKKHRYVVVRKEEMPVQVIREQEMEDGTIVHYITTEEALTQSINKDLKEE